MCAEYALMLGIKRDEMIFNYWDHTKCFCEQNGMKNKAKYVVVASAFISLSNMFIFIQCWTQDQWKMENWTTTDANTIYTTCKIKPSLFSV